jgi:hypothetical protein
MGHSKNVSQGERKLKQMKLALEQTGEKEQ